MEMTLESVSYIAALLVPAIALWAIVCLYTQASGCKCHVTEVGFFAALLLIAAITVRTVLVDDGCWLIHTSSLGVMIVAGVMRKPTVELEPLVYADFITSDLEA